ncbi:hypothetical protein ACFLRN_03005 [Thermoproteota archaeon]
MKKKKPWFDVLFILEKFHPLPLFVTCSQMYLIMQKIASDNPLHNNLTLLIPAGLIYFIAIGFESWRIGEEYEHQEMKRRINSQT